MKKIISSIALALLLTGCGSSVISEGNFGLSKIMFTGTYDKEPIGKGFEFGLIESVHEFYGREQTVAINDVRPKDKDNILLEDLDLVVIFKINPDKAVDYLVATGDYVSDSGEYYIGRNRIERDAKANIGATVKKFTSASILDNQKMFEEEFKKDLQIELDGLYGKDTLILVDIKTSTPRVAQIIEEKIQQLAIIENEKIKNNAIKTILKNRQETLALEAKTISSAAQEGGISVDQLLYYEMIKTLREDNSHNTTVTIPATTTK